jgi:hypothetical protein
MRSGCAWKQCPATLSTSEIAACLDYTTKAGEAGVND